MSNAVDFAFDYIYHHEDYKERHPSLKGYKFGKMKSYGRTPIDALYRGLYFETKEQYEAFKLQIHNNTWTLADISSWSVKENIASLFVITPYVKNKKGYCGVVIKARNVVNKQVLFDTLIAHWMFGKAGKEFPDNQVYLEEMELVLKPTTVEVESVKVFNFAELEKAMAEDEKKKGEERA